MGRRPLDVGNGASHILLPRTHRVENETVLGPRSEALPYAFHLGPRELGPPGDAAMAMAKPFAVKPRVGADALDDEPRGIELPRQLAPTRPDGLRGRDAVEDGRLTE